MIHKDNSLYFFIYTYFECLIALYCNTISMWVIARANPFFLQRGDHVIIEGVQNSFVWGKALADGLCL